MLINVLIKYNYAYYKNEVASLIQNISIVEWYYGHQLQGFIDTKGEEGMHAYVIPILSCIPYSKIRTRQVVCIVQQHQLCGHYCAQLYTEVFTIFSQGLNLPGAQLHALFSFTCLQPLMGTLSDPFSNTVHVIIHGCSCF